MSAAEPKCVRIAVTAEYADGSRVLVEATNPYEVEFLHPATEPGEELVLKSPSIGNASLNVHIAPGAEPVRYREIPPGAQ